MRVQQEQVAAASTAEPPPSARELAAMLEREAAEMCAAWLALPEFRRHEYKRQIESESLQYRKPAEGRGVTAFGQAGKERERQPV